MKEYNFKTQILSNGYLWVTNTYTAYGVDLEEAKLNLTNKLKQSFYREHYLSYNFTLGEITEI